MVMQALVYTVQNAEEKALGTGQYSDDIYMDGMIYAKALRSKYPRARVDRVDVSKGS